MDWFRRNWCLPFLVDWFFSVSFVPGTLCVCNFAISRLNLERFFLVGKSSSEVLGEKIIFLWLEWFAVALDHFGVFPTDVTFLCLSNEEKGCSISIRYAVWGLYLKKNITLYCTVPGTVSLSAMQCGSLLTVNENNRPKKIYLTNIYLTK